MADLTTIGTAALTAIADGDVHWMAEAIVSLDALLTHNGWVIVVLALIYSLHKLGMAFLNRWLGMPRRRSSDASREDE